MEMRFKVLLPLLVLLSLPIVVEAQFNYTTNDGTIIIRGYAGPGGAVAIPSTIDGLPVASIADDTFQYSSISSITIPDSVNSIGYEAFSESSSLTNVAIGAGVTNIGEIGRAHV